MDIKNNYVAKFAHKIGMDGAIAYSSSAARVFQAFAGVVSIFFMAIRQRSASRRVTLSKKELAAYM